MELLESYKIDVSNSMQTELISRTITFLKFPLAVLVVILHTNPLTKPTAQIGVYDLAANYPFFSAVTWFFSRVIAYAAVPSFFVISGFLLFYNVEHFDKRVYFSKMRRRVNTLIIPYIVWNIIYFIVLWNVPSKEIPLFDHYDFHNETNIFKFLFELFIRPLDGPLWFIRNLVVMTLMSPLFFCIIRKSGLVLSIILLLLTQFVSSAIVESLLWFSVGITMSVMRVDFLRLCRDMTPWCLVIFVFAMIADILDLYFISGEHRIIGHFSIFKIMIVFGVGYWIIQHRPHLLSSKLINNSTFIIYAYHGAPQCWLLGFTLPFFIQIGEKGLFVCYLADILIVIGVGLLLSMLIHKSRLLSQILTGR